MTRFFHSPSWRFFVLPQLLTLAALFLGCCLAFLPGWLCVVFMGVFLFGLIFFLVSAIVWFTKKNKKRGFLAIACLLLSLVAIIPALFLVMFNGMLAEDMDDFANALSLPENVQLLEPGKYTAHPAEPELSEPDSFQAALQASLETPGTSDSSVVPSIPALGSLHSDHPALLRRYLTVSPAWWFHVTKGNEFATRRWRIDGRWETNLHGHFSSFFPPESQKYQVRTCLGMSGKSWKRWAKKIPAGEEIQLPVTDTHGRQESSITWDESGIVVEMFEQAETEERRMTKAAIKELQSEFQALLENPTWDHAKTLLPEGAILRGEHASFSLTGSGGIYTAIIRCNPGEPGCVYLKAYEITGNTRLSEDRLKKRSTELIGWSEDPKELFRSSFQFTIYEGELSQFYGARFEVWFAPENGKDDRKLIESNWKIDGWSR